MLDTTTINNQVTGIKTAWYWHTGRRVDQWNKIENLETNTAIHGHLVFCFFFFFWLHWVFVAAPVLSLGATLCRGAQASQCGIFPCGAQALGTQASVVATCGLSS